MGEAGGVKTIPPELFSRYAADPLALDTEVRKALKLPDDRYYTVEVWPVAGRVRLTGERVVRGKKISKSES